MNFLGIDLHAAIVQKPIEDSYLRVIRYETAIEAEDRMVDTALPLTQLVFPENTTEILRPGSYL